ncbi:MAG: glycosyltransferase [Bacteroidales bacterium]|nr:glycosyltransferase [Bacteroidales bacterium]MDY0216098.1 glycosyltransferase [Bacteroidales bacterium]
MKISNNTVIVIPCYNEENRLPVETFLSLIQKHENFKFIFVNDGSSDDTLSVLQNLTAQNDRCALLNLEKNVGKAEAVRQGILLAIEDKDENLLVGFYDADMSTPFEDMLKMANEATNNEYFMVAGCRIKRMGGDIQRRYFRFLFGRVFATAAASILKLPVYDTQCGAKIIKADIAKKIFKDAFVSKWLFDIELFARIIKLYGFDIALEKILEFPLSAWIDVRGSKLGLKDIIRQPVNLYKIKRHYKIKTNKNVK